jgi:hypothetical protein
VSDKARRHTARRRALFLGYDHDACMCTFHTRVSHREGERDGSVCTRHGSCDAPRATRAREASRGLLDAGVKIRPEGRCARVGACPSLACLHRRGGVCVLERVQRSDEEGEDALMACDWFFTRTSHAGSSHAGCSQDKHFTSLVVRSHRSLSEGAHLLVLVEHKRLSHLSHPRRNTREPRACIVMVVVSRQMSQPECRATTRHIARAAVCDVCTSVAVTRDGEMRNKRPFAHTHRPVVTPISRSSSQRCYSPAACTRKSRHIECRL